MNTVTGGCSCGAVRYRTKGPPDTVLYCHCKMCRKATGQPLVAGGYFRLVDVEFIGTEAKRFISSPFAERGFCANCGTPIFYHSTMPELSEWVCLMLGTFDEPEKYPPQAHWNTETALPFVLHDDGLDRHKQADSPYVWVRDSISD